MFSSLARLTIAVTIAVAMCASARTAHAGVSWHRSATSSWTAFNGCSQSFEIDSGVMAEWWGDPNSTFPQVGYTSWVGAAGIASGTLCGGTGARVG